MICPLCNESFDQLCYIEHMQSCSNDQQTKNSSSTVNRSFIYSKD